MPAGAGPLDRRIIIERAAPGAPNAYNEQVPTWSTFIEVWAHRRDVRDSEKVQAGQAMGSLMSRFRIRSSIAARTVTTADRLNVDGKTWQIHGVKETGAGRQGYLEITASAEID